MGASESRLSDVAKRFAKFTFGYGAGRLENISVCFTDGYGNCSGGDRGWEIMVLLVLIIKLLSGGRGFWDGWVPRK